MSLFFRARRLRALGVEASTRVTLENTSPKGETHAVGGNDRLQARISMPPISAVGRPQPLADAAAVFRYLVASMSPRAPFRWPMSRSTHSPLRYCNRQE